MRVARVVAGTVVNIEEAEEPLEWGLVPATPDVQIGMSWTEERGFHVRDPLEPAPDSIGAAPR